MNESLIEEFIAEIDRFEITDELCAKQHTADQHAREFRERFPVERIRSLRLDEYRSPYRNRDDFCAWLTTRTSDVVYGRIPWGQNKLGSFSHYPIGLNISDNAAFESEIRHPLVRFVESRGQEMREQMHRAFGFQLMLKILALYHPDTFFNVVKVSWVEQIAAAFGLSADKSVIDQSAEIRQFCIRSCQNRQDIADLAIDKIFEKFVGLQTPLSQSFVSFLQSEASQDESIAFLTERTLRSFSNRLQEMHLITRPVSKITDEGIVNDLYKFCRGNVEECSSLDWYRKFLTYQSKANRAADRDTAFADLTDQLALSVDPANLARQLRANALKRKFVSHYTVLSSLLYMTDGHSIRLTRGDDPNMNDQLEWRELGKGKLWKRTFITCFSGCHTENAALWAIYGKPSNEAVRLSFSPNVIHDWLSHVESLGYIDAELCAQQGNQKVKIPFSQCDLIFGDVLYGGSLTKAKRNEGSYTYRGRPLSKSKSKMSSAYLEHAPEMTGLIKSADWSYEDEIRLIVRIRDSASIEGGLSLDDVKYVYLPIPDTVLSRIEVMTGPCVPDKLTPIVHSVIQHVGMKVSDSIYHGKLNFR